MGCNGTDHLTLLERRAWSWSCEGTSVRDARTARCNPLAYFLTAKCSKSLTSAVTIAKSPLAMQGLEASPRPPSKRPLDADATPGSPSDPRPLKRLYSSNLPLFQVTRPSNHAERSISLATPTEERAVAAAGLDPTSKARAQADARAGASELGLRINRTKGEIFGASDH